MQSHVHKGRSVVTGSSSTSRADFPRDYPLAAYDVLDAPRTRRASPLLAGCSPGSLPTRAIHLPDKEFRLRPYSDLSELDITSLDDIHCMSPCRRDHLIIRCPGCLAYGL